MLPRDPEYALLPLLKKFQENNLSKLESDILKNLNVIEVDFIENEAGSKTVGTVLGLFRGISHAGGRMSSGAIELIGFWVSTNFVPSKVLRVNDLDFSPLLFDVSKAETI